MTDPDSDDDFDPEDEDGSIPCPHCESTDDCEHQILLWSECNGDWAGPFADATRQTEESLRLVLWQALRSNAKAAVQHKWPFPLSAFVRRAAKYGLDPDDPNDCDWDELMRDYWFELRSDRDGCLDHRWTSENGGPGGDDSFGTLFAEHPHATIADLKALAEGHIGLLRDWSASRRIEP